MPAAAPGLCSGLMGAVLRAAIAPLAAILLGACGGGTDERGDLSTPRRDTGDCLPLFPPPAGPGGTIDRSSPRDLPFAFRALDDTMHLPQPTTPATMTRLAQQIDTLAESVRRNAPEGAARDAALQALRRLENRIIQGLVIWSEERTMATMRRRWVALRERHFCSTAAMRAADPGLDAAQGVRVPDHELNLFELLRRGEEAWDLAEGLLHEMERLPEEKRYVDFVHLAYRYNGELGPWYRQKLLRLPRECPHDVRSAWTAVETARTGVVQLLTMPWGRQFMQFAPNAIRGRAERLRRLRTEIEVYFADDSPERAGVSPPGAFR